LTKQKLRIAHLAGPTATIQNTPPLVTSNKARARHDLPLRTDESGGVPKFDALRAQRLAAPAKVYVEQFSAHPLEKDAAELYGPPDGYLTEDGRFTKSRSSDSDKPVYEIELLPEDGLYPLPYMARQADGQAWEEEGAGPLAPRAKSRQGFYPDGSRSFEEIDRLGIGYDGLSGLVSSLADVDFYRVLPPAGYVKGLPAAERSDEGEGDIPAEKSGTDFFPYKPYHLGVQPPRPALARVTNHVQAVMSSGLYDGAVWTQGSPNIEETSYWFNLLIDTTAPIACNAAQRPQGQLSADGPHNIVDSLRYIKSNIWADENGRNRLGTLLVQEQQFFAAREVAKVDARPGGYSALGGHGGILGQISHSGRIAVTYLPAYKHTWRSELRLPLLPAAVEAVRNGATGLERIIVTIKDADGQLLETAIPSVSIIKDGGYCGMDWSEDPDLELDLMASVDHKLGLGMLGGFVVEGLVPYGNMTSAARLKVIQRAVYSGIPVARVGRGATEGFADPHPFIIAGSNLTSTKARMLLMACLMKFGSYPSAKDPLNPTAEEKSATAAVMAKYQEIFESH
jgi:L-asparaginase